MELEELQKRIARLEDVEDRDVVDRVLILPLGKV